MAKPDHHIFHLSQLTSVSSSNPPVAIAANAVTNVYYSRGGFNLIGHTSNPASLSRDISASNYTTGWTSFAAVGLAVTALQPFFILKGATLDFFRLMMVSTAKDWKPQYWNGSIWVDIGGTISSPLLTGTSVKIVIKWVIHASAGSYEIWANGALVASITGINTAATGDTKPHSARMQAPNNTSTSSLNFFEWMFDANDLRKIYVGEVIPTANGGQTAWTGDRADVDEYMGAPVTTDFISSATAGQIETFTFAAHHADLATYAVKGVTLAMVASAPVDPALFIKGQLRKSSINYNMAGLAVQPSASGWLPFVQDVDIDPQTTNPWASVADIETYELGVKSQAAA